MLTVTCSSVFGCDFVLLVSTQEMTVRWGHCISNSFNVTNDNDNDNDNEIHLFKPNFI